MSKDDKYRDLLCLARHRMDMAISAYDDSRNDEVDDLRFYAASPDNNWQWPSDVLSTRGSLQGQSVNARPTLTFNMMPQHVRQITNDQRQNRPSGKVIPVDSNADIEMAEKFDGMIRHIEYISDADVAYDTACENQVTYGEGYIRILTEYCDDNSFDQDIKIGRIRNSFSVYMDPMIQDPCGADAQWCFVVEDIYKDDFHRLYPDAEPISSIEVNSVGNEEISQWIQEDTVRIAEYFYVEYEKKTLNLYPNNLTAFSDSDEAKELKALGVPIIKTRQADVKKVKWCKTNGFEILEESEWVGSWIPVVRVVGNEFLVDGKTYLSGIIRNAKDAQRMLNYWRSQEAEMLALAPKAPFIGYAGQFEGFENQWKTANTNNWPYLEVNPSPRDQSGAVLPLPQRSQPPMPQLGVIEAARNAIEDIKATTGQYDASLGQSSNERSGKAIMARERQTDTSTYHYVDNLSRAVRYVTRQIVELIPKIYDTQRIARIVGEDGEVDLIEINPEQQQAVQKIKDEQGNVIKKMYNPGVGKYDVCVTTGPSYMTKRQEALEGMSQLIQANPDLWKIAGDLFVKNMDWPGAQELSKRFSKVIDPKIVSDQEDPALQAANTQIQQMGMEMDKMHQMLLAAKDSIEAEKVKIDKYKADISMYDAETKRLSAMQSGLSQEQIQDIVMGTLHAAMQSGDILARDQINLSDTPEQYQQPEGVGTPEQYNTPENGDPLVQNQPPEMGQM